MVLTVAWRRSVLALPLLALCVAGANAARASSDRLELAQAQTTPTQQATPAPQATPTPSPSPAPAPAADAQPAAPEEPIGNVASVTGIATVVRDKNSYPLKARDDIYLNDIVQTASNSTLSITFNDATTFNLSASAKITIDNYVYEDGGKQNSGIFDIGKGTVAFVAAAVAKTGDMKITTPTATLGIRGTTGVVEVPAQGSTAAAGAANNVNIKLYPDADGRVGHIDVNDRTSGTRLGALTQGASGFAIRPATAGARFAAVPITIPPQQVARDRVFVSQVHLAQTTGRQIVTEQRDFRRANPTAAPRIPRPLPPTQPLQQQRPNGAPGQPQQQQQQPQRPNGLPGQNRPGQNQPGAPNRPGTPTPTPTSTPQRQGQGGGVQPGAPRTGQGQQQGQQQGVGQGRQQGQQGTPRAGQTTTPGAVTPPTLPRTGQPPAVTPQPGTPPLPQTPRSGLQGQPVPPIVQPQQGAMPRQGGLQPRLPAPPKLAPRKPPPKEKERR